MLANLKISRLINLRVDANMNISMYTSMYTFVFDNLLRFIKINFNMYKNNIGELPDYIRISHDRMIMRYLFHMYSVIIKLKFVR